MINYFNVETFLELGRCLCFEAMKNMILFYCLRANDGFSLLPIIRTTGNNNSSFTLAQVFFSQAIFYIFYRLLSRKTQTEAFKRISER